MTSNSSYFSLMDFTTIPYQNNATVSNVNMVTYTHQVPSLCQFSC